MSSNSQPLQSSTTAKNTSEPGELTWCPGPNETPRRSRAFTIKGVAYLWYSTKPALFLMSFGKQLRVPLPTKTLKLFGAYLETQLVISDVSKSVLREVSLMNSGIPPRLTLDP